MPSTSRWAAGPGPSACARRRPRSSATRAAWWRRWSRSRWRSGSARQALLQERPRAPERRGRAWASGFTVGVINPETLVFFVAFLPQFTDPGSSAFLQLVVLALAFGAMAVVADSVWAVAAGRARLWSAREPRRLDAMGAAGGTMMVGLGLGMVVVGD